MQAGPRAIRTLGISSPSQRDGSHKYVLFHSCCTSRTRSARCVTVCRRRWRGGLERERSEAMTLNDNDVVTWTFNSQRTSCTVRIARLMLAAAHHDWSDERIEQELLVRIEVEGQA